VRFHDPDRGFIILELADGASLMGNAFAESFVAGQQYRFHGRWADGKFGPEFKFETYTRDVPLTQSAVVKYLSETCRGVGKVTAERLWSKYGSDAVRMLREQPLDVANAGILGRENAEEAGRDLERFQHSERTKVELFGLFAGKGFRGEVIDRAIAQWGVRAPGMIRKNPFRLLLRRLPGCGFKRCDNLFLELGLSKDRLVRQCAAAWNAIREDRSGSTWTDAQAVFDAVLSVIPTADPVKAMRYLIRGGWIRLRRGDGIARYVAVRERADAEQRIADNVRRLMAHPSLWPTDLIVSTSEGDGLPSVHQREQILAATRGAVGCYVGGPGTGKTHSLSFLLKQAIAEHGVEAVAVCAPTGKAAVRAKESLLARNLGIPATTIHSLLEIGRNGHDGDGWGFIRNRENPLDVRLVVVDESSMIDAGLMADLLDALPDGACVLGVGDPFQLAPVGHGAPLRDLLAAGVPQGELTEVRRNSGAIVEACAAIKAGRPVEFCAALDLDAADPRNLMLLDCKPDQSLDVLGDVLAGMSRFDAAWECQVITATNDKSDLSRVKLNERFGKLLNPDGHAHPKNPFRVGDKIICLRNTRLKAVEPIGRFGQPDMALDAANYQPLRGVVRAENQAEQYVANGEIGRVVAVSEKATVARFGGASVPLVTIGNKAKRAAQEEAADAEAGASGDFDLAWAITTHKSQGSETPCVIVMIDDAGSQIADRNWWYTAISRARSACLVIGPKSVFDRQVKRVSLNRRRTFLPELLRAAT
jgi:exodeoxyribonuclease V alpha subunit